MTRVGPGGDDGTIFGRRESQVPRGWERHYTRIEMRCKTVLNGRGVVIMVRTVLYTL